METEVRVELFASVRVIRGLAGGVHGVAPSVALARLPGRLNGRSTRFGKSGQARSRLEGHLLQTPLQDRFSETASVRAMLA